jgi:hypothetical protein
MSTGSAANLVVARWHTDFMGARDPLIGCRATTMSNLSAMSTRNLAFA